MKTVIIGLLMLGILILPSHARVPGIYDFTPKTIEGKDQSLVDYKGQVLLIVNTPSHCGSTPQYTGLEKLYQRYKSRGLNVLAFPSDDFPEQESGDPTKLFCELNFKTSFPSFSPVSVKGPRMAPLYQYLTTSSGFNGSVSSNFNKFLVDRQGHVIARFDSKTDPMDPQLEEDVLRALAQR